MAKGTKLHTRYKNAAGKVVPSVTTVIKNLGWSTDVLIAWARREAMAGNDPMLVRDAAGNIGTLAHYLIECHLTKRTPELADYSPNAIEKAENAFLAYLDWAKGHEIELVASELKLVSEELQYGGTIDKVCRVDGVLEIWDFATGNAIYTEKKIQVSAYVHAYNEVHKPFPPICDGNILRLGKDDASFEHLKMTSLADYFHVFELLRELHNYKGAL